jgi:hypothetical protein
MPKYLVTEATQLQVTVAADEIEVNEAGHLRLFRAANLYATWAPGAWLRAVQLDEAPTKPHIVEDNP